MAIQIEEGIEVPAKRVSEVRETLEALKVGQSFKMPLRRMGAITTQAHWVAKRLNVKFICRAISDSECRVWRTA